MRQEGKTGAAVMTGIPSDGPFIGLRDRVGADVIDINGHMNVLGFDKLFDEAENRLFHAFGMGEPYLDRTGKSMFRLEKLLRYESELFRGDAIEIRSYLLATDFKRVHHFHELWDLQQNRRSAMFDALSIHVDLATRRAAVIDDAATRQNLSTCAAIHAGLPRPEGALDRRLTGKR